MENKNAQLLNKNWQFRNTIDEKWYDAIVPGCVHLDLLENKLIPNPFVRNNEKKLQWIAEENWTYRLHFVPEKEILRNKNKVIFFEGLDTYADIFLNGIKILSSNNMFHPWEKEITQLLIVDLALSVSTKQAGLSDNVEDTVDYSALTHSVTTFIQENPFQLIESVAEQTAERILSNSKIHTVTLTIKKPGAIQDAKTVGITITRTQPTR